jgi:hypothetical protein
MKNPNYLHSRFHDSWPDRQSMWRSWSLAQILFLCRYSLSFVPKLSGQIPDAWQPVPKDDLALTDNPANPGYSARASNQCVCFSRIGFDNSGCTGVRTGSDT